MEYLSQDNRLPPEQKPNVQTADHQMIPVPDARLWRGAGGLLSTAESDCSTTAHRLNTSSISSSVY